MDETKAGQEAGTPRTPDSEKPRNWTDTLNALLVAVQSVDLAMKQAEYLQKQQQKLFEKEIRSTEKGRARLAAREARTERLNLAATALNGLLAAGRGHKEPGLVELSFKYADAMLAAAEPVQPAPQAPPTPDGSASMAGKEK